MVLRASRFGLIGLLAGSVVLAACGDDDDDHDDDDDTSTTQSSSTTTTGQTTSTGGTGGDPTGGGGGDGGGGQATGGGGSGGAGGGSALEEITCDVVVIGGGVGGLHTAFRLAPELGDGVCLFEKEAILGGRIKDVSFDDDPEAPRFGVGARRVMPQQEVLLSLAEELGITLEAPELGADLVNARGIHALTKEELLPAYPAVSPHEGGDTETFLYEELLFGPAREAVGDYADFRTFVADQLGNEELAFLHDASRFRADFEAPLDARGYMDYLTEEWDVYGTPSYPVGGMTEFVRGMEAAATEDGARIFTGEPVARIDRDGAGYTIETGTHRVATPKVVVAVPPVALEHIEGDVVDDLRAQQELQDILGIKVVTVTQWWDDAWWTQIQDPETATQVWRGWTTEHCINFIEIPLEPYAVAQNVTRSVYDDDANCVELWETLWEQGGEDAVAAEVQRGLEHLFVANGVTTPDDLVIPAPARTLVQVWPAAWHWLRAGTELTNQDVFDWAVEPLAGEDVALVGEAYHVNRSGWSDGAYKSSIHLLNTKYGMTLEGL